MKLTDEQKIAIAIKYADRIRPGFTVTNRLLFVEAIEEALGEGDLDDADDQGPQRADEPDGVPCSNCGGEGQVRDYQRDGEDAEWQKCHVCDGTGKLEPSDEYGPDDQDAFMPPHPNDRDEEDPDDAGRKVLNDSLAADFPGYFR